MIRNGDRVMSKGNKEFKERLKANRNKPIMEEEKSMIICHDTEIVINNEPIVVKVDGVFARLEDIEEQITDLFRVKNKFIKGEKIELSKIVDVDFDISYIGIVKEKQMFRLC